MKTDTKEQHNFGARKPYIISRETQYNRLRGKIRGGNIDKGYKLGWKITPFIHDNALYLVCCESLQGKACDTHILEWSYDICIFHYMEYRTNL